MANANDNTAAEVQYRQFVNGKLDQYEALDGKPRAQTQRNALACTAVEAIVHHRRVRDAKPQPVPAGTSPGLPKGWPRCRVDGRWNGKCVACSAPAACGQWVAWDPKSGRPSKWRHLSCADPFTRPPQAKRAANGQGRLL